MNKHPEQLSEEALLTAQSLLSEGLGVACEVSSAEDVAGRRARSAIYRLHLEGMDVPASVIVKIVRPEEGETGDPVRDRFFREWSALTLLSRLAPDVAPFLHGGNAEQRLLIMEDLGDSTSLADLLLSNDSSVARRGCLAFATALGRMHGATAGCRAEFVEVYRSLSGTTPSLEIEQERNTHSLLEKLPGALSSIGLGLPSGAESELKALTESLVQPGPLSVLVHGDPCPDNNVISGSRATLIDFEVADVRSALFDGVYAQVPFPTCWCVNRLPVDVVARMEQEYRHEFLRTLKVEVTDADFATAQIEALAFWIVNDLAEWLLPTCLERDSPWGLITKRQRLLMRLPLFEDFAQRRSLLPNLTRLVGTVRARLSNLWPDVAPVPLYPAFRSSD